jgi:hypothetical protein
MRSENIVNELLSNKTELIKLVLGAIILGIGTNMLASLLMETLKERFLVTSIITFIFTVFPLLFFIYQIARDSTKETKINAVFILEKSTKKIERIYGYDFSEQLAATLNAVFIENKAFKNIFENSLKIHTPIPTENSGENKENNSKKLGKKTSVSYMSIVKVNGKSNKEEKLMNNDILDEAIEYVILEKLSLHLSSYFQTFEDEDKLIKEYSRADIPEMLLQNRILNLITTDFGDRQIFAKSGISKAPSEGEIVKIYGSDGSVFNRFDLVLPKGSKVTRPQKGVLNIENERLVIQIEIQNDGFSANLPIGFGTYYLGKNSNQIDLRSVVINLRYQIKPIAIFARSKWNYHSWIDSFRLELIEFSSFSDYLKRINWEATLTNIIVNNQRIRLLEERKESKTSKK